MAELMMTSSIITRSPFKDLFTINPVVLKAIEDDMRENKFDDTTPIILWGDEHIVLDGYTHLQAAINIGLEKVSVNIMDCDTEKEALDYAIHCQRDRRNLSELDIFNHIEAVIQSKPRGGDHKSTNFNLKKLIPNQPSHIEAAQITGFSTSKVLEVCTILKSKNKEAIKEEIGKEMTTISGAASELRKRKVKDPLTVACKHLRKNIIYSIQASCKEGVDPLQAKQIA